MKKTVSFILSLLIIVTFCGCGTSSVSNSTSDSMGAKINFNTVEDFSISIDSYDTPVGATIGFSDTTEDFSISIDSYDTPVGATIGFSDTTEDFSVSIDSYDTPVGATIDFNFSPEDFVISVEPVEVTSINVIDFQVPSFEFDFTVEPVRVSNNIVSFEYADYQFSIDESTFDVEQFAAESVENFSEEVQAEISQMPVDEVVLIAETRANLLANLKHAFKTSGLDVVVDEERGEIMLDSSVLFGLDKSDISSEGKAFLQKFMTVYTTVVFNSNCNTFISRVMVEGHTDSSGSYDYNLSLSQRRADSVKAFCLSEECGTGTYITELENVLESVGYSCDKPIYDANGVEDRTASRRVSFRFLISLP